VGAARTHPRWRTGRWLAVIATCATVSALAAATPAEAAQATIDGSPLNISADDTGLMQVTFDGSTTGEFTPRPGGLAYAGFSAAIQLSGQNFTVFGLSGTLAFSPAAPAPAVTGSGTGADPFVLTANFNAMSGTTVLAQVTERLSYANGSPDVNASYTVTSSVPPSAPIQARFFAWGDLFVAGSDTGTGVFAAGPPREVGAVHPLLNGSGRLVEIPSTPWSHYQEATYSTISNAVSNVSPAVQGFLDSADPSRQDAAAGVQWNIANLPLGVPVAESVRWRFTRTTPIVLAATASSFATGQTATVNVTARDGQGNPDPGRSVRYSITGVNPGAGAVTTAADGTAAIRWTGTKVGTDTLTAFVDRDGNGVRDVNSEPQQTATVTWTQGGPIPPPPPVPGKSVVVQVVSGKVFIKRAAPRGVRATTPLKGFVPFTGAANIPVGSQLDTRKGRVKLTSAADTGGKKTQASDFYDGIFQVKQALPKKKSKKAVALTTDVVMKGQLPRSGCAPLKGASAAAVDAKKKGKKGPKSVLGKLWGNGKGKFRTTGKYSSATVRGTIWLVEDRCDGTLTKVTRGVVSVRDFKRKKTVKVKARHSYLARAQRAASKTKRRR
jgi:hypothetical protein